MKPILVQLDDYTAKLLEKVAPGRGRKRSRFIREAVIRALMDVVEERTKRAYERQRAQEGGWFDPAAWAPESEAIHPGPGDVIARARSRREIRPPRSRKAGR
jgi:hypothetical protein